MNITVGENVGDAFGHEVGSGESEHASASTGTVRKEKYIGVATGRDGRNFKVVDAYCATGAIGEGHRVDGPAHRIARGLTSLVLEAAVEPSSGVNIHSDPL